MPLIKRDNLILLFITLLFCFVISEVFLRVRFPTPKVAPKPAGWAIIPEQSWIEYDAQLGWFHQKNKAASLTKSGQTIPLRTNSLGLRGTKEYAPDSSQTKIYALGDSFTFGFGVNDAEAFPAQMESLHTGLDVLNLGVAGYGVDQMYLLLKKFGFAYKPKVVLIALFPEDFWRSLRAFNDAGFGKPYFTIQNNKLELNHVPVPEGKNFDVVQFPEIHRANPVEKILLKSYLYRLSKRALTALLKKMNLEDPDSSPEWILGKPILMELLREVRSHDVIPVLVIIPPHRWLTGTDEPIRQSLLRFAERNQTEIVDLMPVFQKAIQSTPIETFYIQDDYHWTAEGNKLVAKTLLAYLKSRGLIS